MTDLTPLTVTNLIKKIISAETYRGDSPLLQYVNEVNLHTGEVKR